MNSEELLNILRERMQGGLEGRLGIEISGLDGDCLLGQIRVSDGVSQPFGMLHGGALAAFAESLGSCAGMLRVDYPREICVGIELNISYMRGVKSGTVFGIAEPLKIGRSLHFWKVSMRDEGGREVAEARLTLMVRREDAAGD
jgi:uncharacterized protein (TIGR00369 family)